MQNFPPINEQMDIIKSSVVDLLPEQELLQKLEKSAKTGKPIRVKLGADPTRPDLHIGHAVILHKMRAFQDLGHTAVLIIGDFTAMIGDPSGKSKTRPQLTAEDTKNNAQSYVEQAGLILKTGEQLEIRYNSEWLGKMSFSDVIGLAAKYTVAQLLEREDFSNRYKNGIPISVHELLYPLAQGIDSVEINSDIELGGTDQKFNLLVGRELQKAFNKEPQCILTMPILEGLDGVEKMSKSLDNYIGLTDIPKEIFGKVMSIPDILITRYLRYAALAKEDEIKKMELGLADGSIHPRNAKVETAIRVTDLYHSAGSGQAAFEEFERIFKNKDLPDVIDEVEIEFAETKNVLEALFLTKLVPSKKEGRRLLEQGGVSVDGEKVTDFLTEFDFSEYRLFKVGKRKFLRIKAK